MRGQPLHLIYALGVSHAISLVIGLLPLAPADVNAFATYYSHSHGLRMVKGFAWALLLLGALRGVPLDTAGVSRRLTAGMTLGVAGLAGIVVWERYVFSGLWNFTNDYRVTPLSAMHVGGAAVDGYLVLALPFAAGSIVLFRSPLLRAGGLAAFALGVYALLGDRRS